MLRVTIILGLALGLAGVAFAQAPGVPDVGFSLDKILRWLDNASPFAAGLCFYLWMRSDNERRAIQVSKDLLVADFGSKVDKLGDAVENANKVADKASTGIDLLNRQAEIVLRKKEAMP